MNLKESFSRLGKFLSIEIWRVTENEVTKGKIRSYNALRTLILTGRGFARDGLGMKASGLTYITLLAIVPTLALIFAIARGFGFQQIIEDLLVSNISAQSDALVIAFEYVQSYLEYASGGVFIGIGIIILMFSVMNLFISIESTFNEIWQVEKSRSLGRQFVNFLAFAVIIPVVLIVTSGLSIFISARVSSIPIIDFFGPVVSFIMRITPYVVNCLLFSVLYLIIPNTKVKAGSAFIAGTLSGILFQLFQLLYINGQMYLTAYNKVYGGFAAIPFLLIWLQISYIIFLFGGELAFASQNNKNYDFETDVKKVTRRYKDFLSIVILTLIVRRFQNEEPPLTAQEIALQNQIPLRLANRLIIGMLDAKIITEGATANEKVITYLPAFDTNKMTVGMVLDRMEKLGSENFKVDKEGKFSNIWNVITYIKETEVNAGKDILIKNL